MAGTLDSGNIFLTDILAPAEYTKHCTSVVMSGERRLMYTSLKDGIKDVIKSDWGEISSDRHTGGRNEAYNWMFGEYQNFTFSFINLCEAFGLDPSYVKRCVNKLLLLPVIERRRLCSEENLGQVRDMSRGGKNQRVTQNGGHE